jgi:hypothetical protein
MQLENDLYFRSVPLRRPVGVHAWPEPHRLEHVCNPPVVAAVARGIEAVSHRGRIIFPWSAAGARTYSTPTAGTFSRPNSTTAPGTGARRSGVASSCTSCRSRHRSGHDLLRGSHGRLHRRLWLGRLHRWNRSRCQPGHHRRIGFYSHELEMLLPGSGAVCPTATASRRSGSSAADDVSPAEIRRADDRRQNEKKDHRVHQKRRGDPFPPLFLFAR